MKTRKQIAQELNNSGFFAKDSTPINENDSNVIEIEKFYIKYPKYQEFNAFGVSLLLFSLKKNNLPVTVYQYTNGDIICIGDIFTAKNAPIVGIGEGMQLPVGFDWANIEKTSGGILKKIDEIK